MSDRQFQVRTEGQREYLSRFLQRRTVPFLAIVGDLKEPRTLTQNARLWLLHTAAADLTGYTPEEMHEEMLCQHFGFTERERKNPWTGEIEMKRIPNKRSSTRDKKEFADFMQFCEMFYGERLGVWLPDRA